MATAEVKIVHAVGLHARPAARFSKLAATFDMEVTVRKGDRVANAKSLLQVLTLEAQQGDVVVIEASGDGSDEALARLQAVLEREE